MSRISIVIPVYNAERYLPATVQGVLSQTFTEWDLVIINDGSHDTSHQLALEYSNLDPRITAISQDNSGVAAARNIGYRNIHARSEYVIFLDHDDVWQPEAL